MSIKCNVWGFTPLMMNYSQQINGNILHFYIKVTDDNHIYSFSEHISSEGENEVWYYCSLVIKVISAYSTLMVMLEQNLQSIHSQRIRSLWLLVIVWAVNIREEVMRDLMAC